MKFKLTTECGYRWRYGFHNAYWKGWYKPRLLSGGDQNWACDKCDTTYWRKTEAGNCCHDSKAKNILTLKKSSGVAFGPVMFFWRFQ